MLQELFTLLTGLNPNDTNISIIIAGAIFALLGLGVRYLYKVNKGIKESPKSPNTFSFKYFITKNWADLLLTIILIFIALRFTQEVLGVELTMWVSFGIGLGIDKIKDLLKEKV